MRDRRPVEKAPPRGAPELRSVTNALRVMEALADADQPMAVTDLAQRLGLAASTTHRILATLSAEGIAVRVPALRRYRAGPGLARLARRSLHDNVLLVEAARPILQRLARESGETSQLTVLDGWDTVAIDHVDSTHPVIVHHPAGSRVPARATAVGQAILAHLPDVAARVARDGLVAFSDRTITDPAAFLAELETIRRRGYAINVGQLHPETAGVAAPIVEASGAVIGSIGISGPAARIGRDDRLAALAELTAAGASDVQARLAEIDAPRHGPPELPASGGAA
jgi:IclR family acetate operon transcriptional repressor